MINKNRLFWFFNLFGRTKVKKHELKIFFNKKNKIKFAKKREKNFLNWIEILGKETPENS